MKNLKPVFAALAFSFVLAGCSSNSQNTSTGDTGDSTSIGAGTDTSGSMVDTGSTVTDSSANGNQ
ncbi:hypothetical protein [Rubrolithibacter danxiaensis]|uniref:hypothetical protein n=1 Tax=Rubrolithibacter danxiaensis TaxID=3390805 RepID=UPI003BF895C4